MQTKGNAKFPLDQLTPAEILAILKRRIHWFLVTAFLVSGLTFVVVQRLPEMYQAETLVLVDPQKVPEKYVTATVSMDVAGRLNTISQEIMSSTRLQRIIETFDLYKNQKGHLSQEEIIERMRLDIKVEVVRRIDPTSPALGAFRISYQGYNPGVVAQVCNQLASLFIEQNLKVREQQAEGTSEFLETQLADAKKKLEEQEEKLRIFKMQHVGELPEQAPANLATLNRLQTQLGAETEALNRARQQELYLQSLLANYGPEPFLTAAPPAEKVMAAAPMPAPTSERLEQLRQQRASLESTLEQMRQRYQDDFPDVKRARSSLDSLNQQIKVEERRLASASSPGGASLSAGASKAVAPGMDPKDPRVALRNQLRMVQSEIESRQAEQARITAQTRGYQGRLDRIPIREQQIVDVQRDYEISKNFYRSLLDKKMSADMAAEMERRQKSERFTILDPARVPEKPFKPNRPAWNFLGLLSGLALGVGLALLGDLRDNSIRKEEEVARTGLRILARIPVVTTPWEQSSSRRRVVRNWALGAAATVMAFALCSALILALSSRLFY